MAGIGMDSLVSLGISAIIGVVVVVTFLPLVENAGIVVVTLTGLIPVLITYAAIRAYL
jgi:hypothetical protein